MNTDRLATGSKINLKLFKNPPAGYRGIPFWSWNCKLDRDRLIRQIDILREMGFGGGLIHPRTGMTTPYMGPEYLSLVKACTEKAQKHGMTMWLYDEDRWPSGFAGGLVTVDPQYRERYLKLTHTPPIDGHYVWRYEIILQNGTLQKYRRLAPNDLPSANASIWYAVLVIDKIGRPRFNGKCYVDTLNPRAIERFVQVTHEVYKQVVGEHFGHTIPAIFTDEPQFTCKTRLSYPEEIKDLVMPWTDDFHQTFNNAYGVKIEDGLPELFWDLPNGKASEYRYLYHDHVAERFASAYTDTISAWCHRNHLPLTGHLMHEPFLHLQTSMTGEAMRHYRGFDIPGIDMLCDRFEFTTVKQTQSAVHQYGRSGMVSELYGVTGWDFTFTGHKGQGDWQAALGVTIRVHHLSWVSMAGESKRDYPASIFYQSPWYREYKTVEDHFARINVAMNRGKPIVKIGVIHPIESYWLSFGPERTHALDADRQEEQFAHLTEWLIFGLADFNFISESLLPSQTSSENPPVSALPTFNVGQMAYDVVMVPGLKTIRSSTLDRLETFANHGGKVIFVGSVPSLVDAKKSDRAIKLAQRSKQIEFNRSSVLEAIEPFRILNAWIEKAYDRREKGGHTESIISQIRQEDSNYYAFLCNTDRNRGRKTVLKFKGDWSITLLDTLTGRHTPLASRREGEWTLLPWNFAAAGSILVELTPGWKSDGSAPSHEQWQEVARLESPVKIKLSEPNVLLLDQAEWRFNDEPWQPKEELLRIDDLIRTRLGLPLNRGNATQPWADHEPVVPLGTLDLKFVIHTEINLRSALLAIEELDSISLQLDGRKIPTKSTGWWVDEAIHTTKLPPISKGHHTLIVSIPITRRNSVEWCYLLGDFGVRLRGINATITQPVRELGWGDWSTQGLPFYAGNVTYFPRITHTGRSLSLEIPRYAGPAAIVIKNKRRAGSAAFPPYRVSLGNVTPKDKIEITIFGNRYNAFGPVHNCKPTLAWPGPDSYRSTDYNWIYEYHLKPMGILSAPLILRRQTLQNKHELYGTTSI